jgi:ubiquinone/menaquinone biosynthesis C-methylase UbiE
MITTLFERAFSKKPGTFAYDASIGGSAPTNFDGSIPETYDQHLGPLLFEFSAKDTARRVAEIAGENAKVLEIAAGTGISTEFLWQELPENASIVATDLSADMLDYARSRRGALTNVAYQQADALGLPFDDESFDIVVCQFGLMFFEDKAKGLAEMARVLRKGGKVVFTVWDSFASNPVAQIAQQTIERFFESDPPQFLRVPWSLHQIDFVKDLVSQTGFRDLSVHIVTETVERPDARDVAIGFVKGNPGIIPIRERVDEEEVVNAVADAISTEYGMSYPQIPLQEICFMALKP